MVDLPGVEPGTPAYKADVRTPSPQVRNYNTLLDKDWQQVFIFF